MEFTGMPDDLKDKLVSIDTAISEQVTRVHQLVNNLSFIHITNFKLGANIQPICDATFNRNGVYFFEIKNGITPDVTKWINYFNPIWDIKREEKVVWFPAIKSGRVKMHKSFKDWIPFYIGKSNYVGIRINEHIHQPGLKHTFGMKLNARENLHGWEFRVSWIPLDVINYDMIAPAVERALRNKFHPIVGRQ